MLRFLVATLVLASAAHAQTSPPSTVLAYRATLASGDETLGTGEFADRYAITVPPGAPTLMVSMTSDDVDTYVLVRGPNGENEDNDDARNSLNAAAVVFSPAPGEWHVTATSARAGEAGTYEIVLGTGDTDAVIDRIAALGPDDFAQARATDGGKDGDEPAQLRVDNLTDQAVFRLYASPCDDDGWGADRLGTGVVAAGAAVTLALAPGCWDLKAQFRDGHETVERQRTLGAGPAVWWLDQNVGAARGALVVRNAADPTLSYVYVSACGTDDWGPDLLGAQVIASGAEHAFPLDPGCWDARARFADGQETVQRDWQVTPGSVLTWRISSD